MAANTQPVFSRIGDIQWVIGMTAANTNANIASGTSYLAFTADITNGGFVREARLKAAPGNNTVATVWRIWLNKAADISVADNSILLAEVGVPATTASSVAPTPDVVCPLNFAIPPGYKIYFTFGTAPGGSGAFMGTVIAGKY